MKNINKILFLLTLSSFVFITSCNEDDHTGDSIINYSKPTVTLSGMDATIDENSIDSDAPPTINVTASISAPVQVDIHIPLVQTGGSANGDDFSAGTIVIVSGDTSASTDVTILKTGDVEGSETLEIGAADNIANANLNPFTLNITINDDYINDVLDIELNWDGEVEYEDDNTTATYNFCAMDFDLLIFDATTGMDTGVYDGATTACPESVGFTGLPDGDYILVVSLYENPYAALGLGESVPVTINYNQEFFDTNGSITINDYSTDSTSGDIPVAIVTKNGYNYTVTPW